jgi:hypothetical protein
MQSLHLKMYVINVSQMLTLLECVYYLKKQRSKHVSIIYMRI